MRKLTNVLDKIDDYTVSRAIEKSYNGHKYKTEVIRFMRNEEENKAEILASLKNGDWEKYIEYVEMDKHNSNGKTRHIFCPSLRTRILQHLFLVLLEPYYNRVDNKNALNCKKECGITAKMKKNSVMKRLKNIFYDKRQLTYGLIIDQRKCYEHVSPKLFRKYAKRFTDDKWFIDFAVKICFVNGKLPIGTPTSPFVHNIIMYEFDCWVKSVTRYSVRYADDNFLAFETKEEANAMKWRIMNFWWYNFHIRAKRHTIRIFPLENTPTYFCGYIYVRNGCKTVCDHNKGYTRVRRMTVKKAKKCTTNESYASYYGLLKHADSYKLLFNIEKNMKLTELTANNKIDRGEFDAKNIDIKDILGMPFTLVKYEMRYPTSKKSATEADKASKKGIVCGENKDDNEVKMPNWIKCLIKIDEVAPDGSFTNRKLAREFHGDYRYLIEFLMLCEKRYGKENLLPIEDAEIESSSGYIFKGSTKQREYFD